MQRVVAFLVALLLVDCADGDAHVHGRVVIAGVSDASGVTVEEHISSSTEGAHPLSTVTGPDGSYGFVCIYGHIGSDSETQTCRVTARAPSTLEAELGEEVRASGGTDTGAPDFVFTPVGELTGVVTLGGGSAGNAGILVAVEGQGATALTDDAGHYVLTRISIGKVTVAASLAGHALASVEQTVDYNTRTTVPPILLQ